MALCKAFLETSPLMAVVTFYRHCCNFDEFFRVVLGQTSHCSALES